MVRRENVIDSTDTSSSLACVPQELSHASLTLKQPGRLNHWSRCARTTRFPPRARSSMHISVARGYTSRPSFLMRERRARRVKTTRMPSQASDDL